MKLIELDSRNVEWWKKKMRVALLYAKGLMELNPI